MAETQALSQAQNLELDLARVDRDRAHAMERVLIYFASYRLVLAITLTFAYWFFNEIFQFGLLMRAVANAAFPTYVLGSVLLLSLAMVHRPSSRAQLRFQFGFDLIALSLLTAASGGVRSGISILLLISVASAALSVRGRFALGYAAAAAIMLLLQQGYIALRFDYPLSDYSIAGISCAGYFAVALAMRALANYAEVSEQLAVERGVDVQNLAKVNELVLQQVQDGVIVVDERGIIRQSNGRVIEWLGLMAQPGVRLADVSQALATFVDAWRERTDTRTTTGVHAMIHLDSVAGGAHSAIPASRANPNAMVLNGRELGLRFVDIGSGNRPIAVIFLEDLARTKQVAQQLKLASLGRLTASIAHEIRNPLSSIGQAADFMREDQPRDAVDSRMLAIIQDNVHRIDRLIEEVLYLNRRDRARPESIALLDFLTNFARGFCEIERIDPSVIAVECKPEIRFEFDRSHLDQIVWNLVRNAVRYSNKAHGSVWIYCRVNEVLIQLGVVDNGPGVAEQDRSHLFEPFFTTDAKGTGIGLYMARELSEANRAQLEYVTEAGGAGAHFRLTMQRV